jgi:hypothetical protein
MNVLDKVHEDIQERGRSVIAVMPDNADPNEAFTYTIGNARIGLPELLVVGSCHPSMCGMLNALSKIMLQKGAFVDGQTVSLGGQYPVYVFDAKEGVKDDFTIQATNYLGRSNYMVMQVVMPDSHGKWPWQADCDEPYCHIEMQWTHPKKKRVLQ